MNRTLVDRIADAVLYEGYILYPYRPALKNRQRWTFGGLFPEASLQAQAGSEPACNQTECLIQGTLVTTIEAVVRFLHLTARIVGELQPRLSEWQQDCEPPFRPVESLCVGDQRFQTWQEAEEREVSVGARTVGELLAGPLWVPFSFAGSRRWEPIRNPAGEIAGVLLRQQQPISGAIEIEGKEVDAGLFRLRLRVVNQTPPGKTVPSGREEAVLSALVSAHTILAAQGGHFVSLLEPPECCREAALGCRNVGVWPVLVGAEGQDDTMLSSPIILYDYPQVAPESPGDFFDGAEIDEMLTLRILTLTDEEKLAMAAVDERARRLLVRTETLGQEQFRGLHGTIRNLRPLTQEDGHG